MKRTLALLLATTLAAFAPVARSQADLFGSGANSFEIEFVTIGDPGNLPDLTGAPPNAGSVPYSFRMGQYEISEQMIDAANALGGLGITRTLFGPNKPAGGVSWFEAARFVNWLNESTGGPPAYKFDAMGTFQLWLPSDPGFNPDNQYRNSHAKYFLPSINEWYKTAYYDPAIGVYYDYPTGSDAEPVSVVSGTEPGTAVYRRALPADITQAGGLSPYGTMAQGGNVQEWNETSLIPSNLPPPLISRLIRGGDWGLFVDQMRSDKIFGELIPSSGAAHFGFRVTSQIPEPDILYLLATAIVFLLVARRNQTGQTTG